MVEKDWEKFEPLNNFLSSINEHISIDKERQHIITKYGEYSVYADSAYSAWKDTVKHFYKNLYGGNKC